jgi:cold shock CspA family protein
MGSNGEDAAVREKGVAQRWNDKGFGFIKPEDGGEDLFCHYSAITDGKVLVQGSTVEYVKRYDDVKGKYRAEEVTGGAPEDALGGYKRRNEVRPGDWTCPGCGSNVFASKSTCFKCQTPKPEGA